MSMSIRSKAPTQTSASLCAIKRSVPSEEDALNLVRRPHSPLTAWTTVALYNVHSTRQRQGGGCHCSDAETGSQQSDRADDWIVRIPRFSTLRSRRFPDRVR